MLAAAPSTTAASSYRLLPHQARAFVSEKRFVVILAGLGSGKTGFGCLWLVKKSLESAPGVKFLLVSNTYTQLYSATLDALYKFAGDHHIPIRPKALPQNSRQPIDIDMWIGDPPSWRRIACRSLEHPDRLQGPEYGAIWIDEASYSKHEGFKVANARLRDDDGPLQMLVTSTKDDPATSWLYEQMVKGYNPETMDVIEAKTADNPYLPEDYIAMQAAILSPREFDRMVENKWVPGGAGAVYYAFDRQVHLSELADFDPHLPVYWCHDFNIGDGKPMSSALCQVKRGASWVTGKQRPFWAAFDELVLESTDTHDAIREFRERAWVIESRWGEDIWITGDASGRARDTRSKTTDYGILFDAGFELQDVPTQNPPIRERHNICNALLQSADGDVRALFHPRLTVLPGGLETVRLRSGAQYLEAESREQHVTTAWGYGAVRKFPTQKGIEFS